MVVLTAVGTAQAQPTLVTCRYLLRNTVNHTLTNVQFKVLGPAFETATQRTLEIRTTPASVKSTDKAGNQVLTFNIDRIAPHDLQVVALHAQLGKAGIEEKSVEAYFEAEPFVESSHPEIRDVASLMEGEGAVETARAIYDWVVQEIRYAGYSDDDLGALWALRHRSGDCTEMAYLFTALCRAKGIPARVIGGYVCRRDGRLRARDYHNWAEFHDGEAWHPVDCQLRQFDDPVSGRVAVRVFNSSSDVRFHRFEVNKDAIEVTMR
jgi:hypothetical protein